MLPRDSEPRCASHSPRFPAALPVIVARRHLAKRSLRQGAWSAKTKSPPIHPWRLHRVRPIRDNSDKIQVFPFARPDLSVIVKPVPNGEDVAAVPRSLACVRNCSGDTSDERRLRARGVNAFAPREHQRRPIGPPSARYRFFSSFGKDDQVARFEIVDNPFGKDFALPDSPPASGVATGTLCHCVRNA